MTKVFILGASGMVGSAILKEATSRGLQVTASSRSSGVKVDADNSAELTKAVSGRSTIACCCRTGLTMQQGMI